MSVKKMEESCVLTVCPVADKRTVTASSLYGWKDNHHVPEAFAQENKLKIPFQNL